ncbi:hypothetical protein IWQ51_006000 [Labrenzia sp. EL_142]|nr:hypothetical protein [Labrenzia sp. EL_142]
MSLKPVLKTGPVLDERHALNLQLLEFRLTLADNLIRFQVERHPHCRRHGRIHLVGLDPLSTRLSKAARLKRVHFDKRETVRKRLFERTMIGPRCLKYDKLGPVIANPAFESDKSLLIIGETSALARLRPGHVQMRF